MFRRVLQRDVARDRLDELTVVAGGAADHGLVVVERDAFRVGRTAEVVW